MAERTDHEEFLKQTNVGVFGWVQNIASDEGS
jgi:hypothetical protein